MAQHSRRRDLVSRDSPPADSPPPAHQGGSGNGARADVARKTKEVDHLLAKLENEGVEINDKIASIIDDEPKAGSRSLAPPRNKDDREHPNPNRQAPPPSPDSSGVCLGAMAMHSLSSTPRRHDSDSGLPPTPQGGSGNGARADVARKTKEVDHLLAKLENEGVEIDGKIASIIGDGIARIRDEAAREHLDKIRKEKVMTVR
uniref:Uncharacterized protein n=1 Tax=Oryza meridionalis TaxID=40149 RepID=A0A0E0CLW8_9ORYZ